MRPALAISICLYFLTLAYAKVCMNITVPITITARNGVFNLTFPQNNLDVTAMAQESARRGINATAVALSGYADVGGTYNISTKFCVPAAFLAGAGNTSSDATNSSSGSIPSSMNPYVQVLTHGIGFDKTYWDLPYNNYNYSYVDSALAEGYCTLTYDRLGIGNSSHGDAINEIQSFLEVQALRGLTTMLRRGTFPTLNHTFGSNIIHIGHSFGSAQTYSFANLYPNETSGIVLTGFSMSSAYVPLFAAGANFQLANANQPLRFGNTSISAIQELIRSSPLADYLAGINYGAFPIPQNLSNGYFVSSDAGANQFLFLLPEYFDTGLLEFAEATKQPVTIGELLTLGSVPMMNKFAGPVLVFTGSNDLPYCGGQCYLSDSNITSIPAGVQDNFPFVSPINFTAYIQPNTGHGLNLHYNATAGYQVIQQFLRTKGLFSS